MTLRLLLMAGRGGKIQKRANIENRISPLAPALPIAYFNNPPIINIQPLVAPLSSSLTSLKVLVPLRDSNHPLIMELL